MGSGEVAIVALSTMISLKVTFSDGLGGVICHLIFFCACIGKVYKSTCHPVTELTLKTEIENEIILLFLIFCM